MKALGRERIVPYEGGCDVLNSLTSRLSEILKKVGGMGSLNEKNIKDGLREIKLALLEADVNYKVVKEFIDGATTEAMGEKVLRSVTPLQQFTKIVNDYLVKILGGEMHELDIGSGGISSLMLCGLQGSGKTTTAVKLAKFVEKKYNKKPLLVAADIYRPAAVEQLKRIGEKSGYPTFFREGEDPVHICSDAIKYARENSFGAVVIDTAGRLEMDEEMMKELALIKKAIRLHEILLVADAATGQAAVKIAQGFDETLGITGLILSRMDSDARGGAALSMSYITGKYIKFIGTGEKVDDFEQFHPARIAGRILDMGDVVSLVEKVQTDFDLEKAKKLEKKIKKNRFDLGDFLDQLKQLQRMGPLENILEMIPGLPKKTPLKIDERELKHTEAIINSMTLYERAHYKVINGSRRKRIALGSGTSVFDVNKLLNNFAQMKKMMKKLGKGGMPKGNSLSSLMQ
jgi:signal recognition particle subunit SRP54